MLRSLIQMFRSKWTGQSSLFLLLLLLLMAVHMPVLADQLLVSAAVSLSDALKEIAALYQADSRHQVNFVFGASSTLARQIDEGAPADIFFSADLAQMDKLEKNGRLEPGTRLNLLSNQLVIAVAVDSRLKIASSRDLLSPDVKRIALADPSAVPAGVYARAYLDKEGVWEQLKPKIIPVLDVRAALAAVESGNVDAGFVYKTDAAISKKIKIAYEVPSERAPKIIYPVAIVRQSTKKDAARDFLKFVLRPESKSKFRKYGFIVLE